MQKSNIVLTGFMGAGKSTVGKLLAERLNLKVIETDKKVEKKAGMTIPKIFSKFGEEGFREMESRIVKDIAELEGYVIVTGGGVVLRGENMKELRRKGIVVYLHAGPEAIHERLRGDTTRPLLRTENPKNRIIELLEQRMPLYRDNDFEVDTSELEPGDVVEKVLEKAALSKNDG